MAYIVGALYVVYTERATENGEDLDKIFVSVKSMIYLLYIKKAINAA